ncbi:MAG: type IV pilin protein [Candidatus Microsaccharimonas sp.]
MKWELKQKGFTIVELLIVVVVIAILAAITIVSYNGITQQSRLSVMQSDISAMNKAILMYHAKHGHYPYSGATGANVTGPSINIPGLSEFLPNPPRIPDDGNSGYYAYIWSANGADYKIIRLVPSGAMLPQHERDLPNIDPQRTTRGWGIWSDGGRTI